MKPAITFLMAALVLFLALYLHDGARRYDVVVAAAGSGVLRGEDGLLMVLGGWPLRMLHDGRTDGV